MREHSPEHTLRAWRAANGFDTAEGATDLAKDLVCVRRVLAEDRRLNRVPHEKRGRIDPAVILSGGERRYQ
jgi:hypothetical protein